jgi:hypothetical protein
MAIKNFIDGLPSSFKFGVLVFAMLSPSFAFLLKGTAPEIFYRIQIGVSLGHFGLLAHAREKRTIPPVRTSLERRPETSSRHHVID